MAVVTVAGNHDRWLLAGTARDLPEATDPSSVTARTRAFLNRLPRLIELDTLNGTALLCHGLGPNDMAKVGADDFGYAVDANEDLQNLLRNRYYRWVLNGHSHRHMVRSFGALTVINAGTLKREHAPCFLEVDFENAEVLVFEFDSDGAVKAAPSRIALR
jgi:predicted phosphodiesterase